MCLQEEEGQEARLSARNVLRLNKEVLGRRQRVSEGTYRRLIRRRSIWRERVETDLESTLSGLSLLAAGVDSENHIPPS